MQRLEVSGAVRPLKWTLGVKWLNIYLNNKRLEQISELKYLGIYFDSRLSFDRHVDYITGKCIPIIKMLGKSAKLNWGMGHRALKAIYL
jgi:hypothetical protein